MRGLPQAGPLIDLTGAARIGVISDTHGLVRPEICAMLEGVDAILHAGDLGSDLIEVELAVIAPFHAVAGNVDGFDSSRYPRFLTAKLGEHRIGVTHVALRGQELLVSVEKWARQEDLDVIIFGHTHKPLIERRGELLLFNPGSCGPARFNLPVSLGFLTVVTPGGELRAEFRDIVVR